MFSFDERAVAQGFSVHVWGTWGPRFKSAQPDILQGITPCSFLFLGNCYLSVTYK